MISYYRDNPGEEREIIKEKPEFYNGLRLEKWNTIDGYGLEFLRKDGYAFMTHFIWENKDLALSSLKAFEHLFKLLGQDIKVENKLVDKNTF